MLLLSRLPYLSLNYWQSILPEIQAQTPFFLPALSPYSNHQQILLVPFSKYIQNPATRHHCNSLSHIMSCPNYCNSFQTSLLFLFALTPVVILTQEARADLFNHNSDYVTTLVKTSKGFPSHVPTCVLAQVAQVTVSTLQEPVISVCQAPVAVGSARQASLEWAVISPQGSVT